MDTIEQNIRNLSDDELIRLVRIEFEQYTDEALFIARNEMTARNIPEQEPDTALEDDSAAQGFSKRYDSNSPDRIRKLMDIGLLSRDRAKWLEIFLADELQYLESCNAILDFVTSMNIRNGEYEGNFTVFKKMDTDNFILYTECAAENGLLSIPGCLAIGKDELVDKINEIMKLNRLELEEEEAGEDDDRFLVPL
jgi:hypothetical protein